MIERLKNKFATLRKGLSQINRMHSQLEKLDKALERMDRKVGVIERSVRNTDENVKKIQNYSMNVNKERHAIVACISDHFIEYGLAFVESLKTSNSIPPNCDFVLLVCDDFAPLSNENREKLTAVLPDLKFETVDTAFLLDDEIKRWEDGVEVKKDLTAEIPQKKATYLKLHMLRMGSYDSLLWLDSDMILRHSVAGLFRMPAALAMVPIGHSNHHYGLQYRKTKRHFNAGLMFIRRKYLTHQWFDRATVLLGEKAHTTIQDQSLLNKLWENEEKLFLPHVYNWKVPIGADAAFHDAAMQDACVVHFIADSKLDLKRDSELALHKEFYSLLDQATATEPKALTETG